VGEIGVAAPSEVGGKMNVLGGKKIFSALNKSEIMKLNKSKFNKCYLFLKCALYVRGSHCGSLPQLSKNLATSLLILVGFQTKNICANLISPIHALPVSPSGVKLMTFGKEYKF
jgi:hypothetical protein